MSPRCACGCSPVLFSAFKFIHHVFFLFWTASHRWLEHCSLSACFCFCSWRCFCLPELGWVSAGRNAPLPRRLLLLGFGGGGGGDDGRFGCVALARHRITCFSQFAQTIPLQQRQKETSEQSRRTNTTNDTITTDTTTGIQLTKGIRLTTFRQEKKSRTERNGTKRNETERNETTKRRGASESSQSTSQTLTQTQTQHGYGQRFSASYLAFVCPADG